MKTVLALGILLGVSSAFASTVTECGYNLDTATGQLENVEITIVSDGAQPVKVYNSEGQLLTNATLGGGPNRSLIVLNTRTDAQGVSHGIKYVIDAFHGEKTSIARKSIIGGVAGGYSAGTMDCVLSEK